MLALKLSLGGDYWDIQIYRGKLHLWRVDGSLLTLDWGRLVDSLAESAQSPFAVRLAFREGELLYGRSFDWLRREPEFYDFLLDAFGRQAQQELDLGASDLSPYVLDEQDNPLSELPIDSEIYNRNLYAVDDTGLWRMTASGTTRHAISTKPQRLFDGSLVSVRAKGNRLALAGAEDGVFEWDMREAAAPWSPRTHWEGPHIAQLSTRHCERADWAFSSIYGSSTLAGGFLVGFVWEEDDAPRFDGRTQVLRRVGEFDERTLLGRASGPRFTWASGEKIYAVSRQGMSASHFTQQELAHDPAKAVTTLGRVDLEEHAQPVGGGVAVFGTIVEYDDRLLVVGSDESVSMTPSPVTRWRVYPRALHYENHLHLILEDRVEIHAFVGDYFVPQEQKRFGLRYRSNRPTRRGELE